MDMDAGGATRVRGSACAKDEARDATRSRSPGAAPTAARAAASEGARRSRARLAASGGASLFTFSTTSRTYASIAAMNEGRS